MSDDDRSSADGRQQAVVETLKNLETLLKEERKY